MLLLSGCNIMVDESDWWSYCDESKCYRCNAEGCEVPWTQCEPHGAPDQCPSGFQCDPHKGACVGKSCSTGFECGAGHICYKGNCIPHRPPCSSHSSCGDGSYCKNGDCIHTKRCADDKDCAALSGSFVCSPTGSCVPGKPKGQACTSGSTCPGGVCVNGECGTCAGDCGGAKTCQYNKHCGSGRVCLDGQCTNACASSSDCGSNQLCQGKVCVPGPASCTKSSQCSGAGQTCVNGQCLVTCTGKCPNKNDICSPLISSTADGVRACHWDHLARLECKTTKDCSGSETCVNGVCRTSCATNTDCAACEDGPVCGTGGYCMTSQEAAPKCSTNSQCTGGKVCLNAQCATL